MATEELDRASFVPLYYQLQETLKERIESGVWRPGDQLPSEPDLARRFGVSRVVVRQALAILEDDRQVVRIQGRGTFVAQPKIDYRAGGLSQLLAAARGKDIALQILDKRTVSVEGQIQHNLGAAADEDVTRITSLMSLRGTPLAISYSFFRTADVEWLDAIAHVGRNVAPDVILGNYGIELAHSRVQIEASQCGQFEADRFGIPYRSAVFLVLCTEYRRLEGLVVPFEVARVEYRGDILQFRLEVPSSESVNELAVTWAVNDRAGS